MHQSQPHDGQAQTMNKRALITLTIAVSGLGLPLTGLFNHLHQSEPMHLTRHAWMAAHNGLAALFVICTIWHVVLNRRQLGRYLKGQLVRVATAGREALLACAIVLGVLGAFVGHALLAG